MGKGGSTLRRWCLCCYIVEVIQRWLQPMQNVGSLGSGRLQELGLFAIGNFVGGN